MNFDLTKFVDIPRLLEACARTLTFRAPFRYSGPRTARASTRTVVLAAVGTAATLSAAIFLTRAGPAGWMVPLHTQFAFLTIWALICAIFALVLRRSEVFAAGVFAFSVVLFVFSAGSLAIAVCANAVYGEIPSDCDRGQPDVYECTIHDLGKAQAAVQSLRRYLAIHGLRYCTDEDQVCEARYDAWQRELPAWTG